MQPYIRGRMLLGLNFLRQAVWLSQSSGDCAWQEHAIGLPVRLSNLLPQVFVKVAPGLKNILMAMPLIARATKSIVMKRTSIVL